MEVGAETSTSAHLKIQELAPSPVSTAIDEVSAIKAAATALRKAQLLNPRPETGGTISALNEIATRFLQEAARALKEAQKLNPRPETNAALKEIEQLLRNDARKLAPPSTRNEPVFEQAFPLMLTPLAVIIVSVILLLTLRRKAVSIIPEEPPIRKSGRCAGPLAVCDYRFQRP